MNECDEGQETIEDSEDDGSLGVFDQIEGEDRKYLQCMHSNKMGHTKVSHCFAPSQDPEIGVVVDGSDAMAQPRTHGKAFKGKYHKNQEAQADGPEVVRGKLGKRMRKKLVGYVGGIQGD